MQVTAQLVLLRNKGVKSLLIFNVMNTKCEKENFVFIFKLL